MTVSELQKAIATLTAAAGAATTLGAGFFGWLRGRAETATAEAKAQTEQLATLTKAFEAQAKTSQILMDRSQHQSEKISSLTEAIADDGKIDSGEIMALVAAAVQELSA